MAAVIQYRSMIKVAWGLEAVAATLAAFSLEAWAFSLVGWLVTAKQVEALLAYKEPIEEESYWD